MFWGKLPISRKSVRIFYDITILRFSVRIFETFEILLDFPRQENGRFLRECSFTPAVWMNISLLRQKEQNIQNPKKNFSNIFLRNKTLNLK